jgi:hypothetical protein
VSGGSLKNTRLAAIVAERGLSVSGYRRSLLTLAREFADEIDPRDQLEEWIGNYSAVPAAFKIRRGQRQGVYGVTVEVYEIEGTVELPEWKIEYYGNCADCDGPCFDLHILDRYDHEIVVECSDLMRFMSLPCWSVEEKRQELKLLRSKAAVQHHAPVTVSLGVDVLQDVIYKLGLGIPQKTIAQQTGLRTHTIRATIGLLTANSVNPKDIVRDTHARWKAAYDAVRELGIQM